MRPDFLFSNMKTELTERFQVLLTIPDNAAGNRLLPVRSATGLFLA
jgi:hypothetical protein